jgi:hypothetical protein
MSNGTPLTFKDEPSRLAENANPPVSRPPVENTVPSVKMPLLKNAEDKSTGRTGNAATARGSLRERVKPPDVPFMVTTVGLEKTDLFAVSVNVLVPVAVIGLNEAVTPSGRPDADRATLPPNSFIDATEISVVMLMPRVRLKEAGDAKSAKSGSLLGEGIRVIARVIMLLFLGIERLATVFAGLMLKK